MGHDALVLQGGGSRCFFTLGFLCGARDALCEVRQIAMVSASSLIGFAHVLGEHERALECILGLVRERAATPLRRALRERRLLPHYHLFRDALSTIVDEERFKRLRNGSVRMRVLLTAGPSGSRIATWALAAWTYLREIPAARLVGLTVEVTSLDTRADLIDTVMASSALPAVIPMPRRDGVAIIDGSIFEPVPLCALDGAARPLIVLNEPRAPRPLPPGIAVIAPPAGLNLSALFFGNEGAIRGAYAAGIGAGRRFADGVRL